MPIATARVRPDLLTPADRRRELASLFATALARLHTRHALAKNPANSSNNDLATVAKQSVTGAAGERLRDPREAR